MLDKAAIELVDDFLNLIDCRHIDQIGRDSHRMWFTEGAYDVTRVPNDYVPEKGEFVDEVVVVFGSGAKFLACTFVGDISIIYIDQFILKAISQYLNIVAVDKATLSGRTLLDYEMMRYFRRRFISDRLGGLDTDLAQKIHANLSVRYKKSFEFLGQLIETTDCATSTVFSITDDEKDRVIINYLLAHELAHVWRKKYRKLFEAEDQFLAVMPDVDFSNRGYSAERLAYEKSMFLKLKEYHEREYSLNNQYRDELQADFCATRYFLCTEYLLFEQGDRVFEVLEILYLAVLDAATKLLELDRILAEILKQNVITKDLPQTLEPNGRYWACNQAVKIFRLRDQPVFDSSVPWTMDNAPKLRVLSNEMSARTEARAKAIERRYASQPLLEALVKKRDRLYFQAASQLSEELAEIREAAR